ncbi:hypothetical protein [Sideroxydans sp. CL21]|nr:hypothetical protein [Sideroxydans sp. CL21]
MPFHISRRIYYWGFHIWRQQETCCLVIPALRQALGRLTFGQAGIQSAP